MKKELLGIKGMTCAVCAQAIEKAVKKLPGIQQANVSLPGEKLWVEYDEKTVTLTDIKEAVANIGYEPVEKKQEGVTGEDFGKEQLEKQQEINTLRTKCIIAAACCLPLLYVAMTPMVNQWLSLPYPPVLSPKHHPLLYALIQLLFLFPILFAGHKFYTIGFKSLWQRSPNMDSLIAIGTSAAVLYSLVNTIQIAISQSDGTESLYFETAAVIITLILLGKFMEALSKGRSNQAIKKLMELAPKTATILLNGKEVQIPVDQIKKGHVFLVKPGTKIPADGLVTEGSSAIDQSMLTGESMPVDKKPGDPVYAATINTTGAIICKAEKIGSDTALAQIIKLVEEAQNSKAPIAKLADTVSGYFVPVVCVISFLSAAFWYMKTGGDIAFALTIFISVLIIACPCALGLATPAAIMVATGKGAEHGILIKNGETLQAAHKIDTVVLDKTGTITCGKPVVTDILLWEENTQQSNTSAAPMNISSSETNNNAFNSEKLLQLTASAEKLSEHPLGQAIADHAQNKGMQLLNVDSFRSITGQGIEAVIQNQRILAGSRELMVLHNIAVSGLEQSANQLAGEGKTPVYVALADSLVGIIAIADTIKQSSFGAIQTLKKRKMEVIMLTGDNPKTAAAIAKQTGIDRICSNVLPGEKADKIKSLQTAGRKVLMIGDGINDAPALIQADVGIAIGSGTDIAMESAGIVLMGGSLAGVPAAINLSRKTLRVMKQNLFWAFAYNCIGIPIAAGLLYLLFGGPLLSPVFAAGVMSVSSVSVITNALRLKNAKL